MEGLWTAFFPDYSIPGLGKNAGYVLSAIFGVVIIIAVFWVLTVLGKRTQRSAN
jgi:hypothetical protein